MFQLEQEAKRRETVAFCEENGLVFTHLHMLSARRDDLIPWLEENMQCAWRAKADWMRLWKNDREVAFEVVLANEADAMLFALRWSESFDTKPRKVRYVGHLAKWTFGSGWNNHAGV